jgi:ribosome-associated protein
MIPVTDTIALEDDELSEKFVRASGPGGQHVNTSSTAVELRFDARNSPSLPDEVKHRLERIAGSRMNQEGVIVIFAQSYRSQEMNRQDARERLVELIVQATHRPSRARRPATYASKLKRLEGKRSAGIKAKRAPRGDDQAPLRWGPRGRRGGA